MSERVKRQEQFRTEPGAGTSTETLQQLTTSLLGTRTKYIFINRKTWGVCVHVYHSMKRGTLSSMSRFHSSMMSRFDIMNI